VQPPPQATVRSYDPATRSGSVLFDDGSELAFGPAAFDRGGLLKVRLGQRVRLVVRGSGPSRSIAALTIVTMPFPPDTDMDSGTGVGTRNGTESPDTE